MKIYTKTGDEGETSLFGGNRVTKTNQRIEAYGTVDELNSFFGLVLSEKVNEKTKEILVENQNLLFVIGSELATPENVKDKLTRIVGKADVENLEKSIDDIEKELKPLKNFILPGGTKSASLLHVCRTICRRAERRVVEISMHEEVNPELLAYINRLSDLLFVLARFENHTSSKPEIYWNIRG